MSPASSKERISSTGVVEEMASYGITCVPVDYFHYGQYRYTNLKDAVTQAKRDLHLCGATTKD